MSNNSPTWSDAATTSVSGRAVLSEHKILIITSITIGKKTLVIKNKFYRIYVDAIINHMTGTWNDNVGTNGSTADFDTWNYPSVPYTRDDFNYPHCNIYGHDYGCCPDRVSLVLDYLK